MMGHNLGLSRKVFEALTSNLELGTTLAQWWLTEEEHRPLATLSSALRLPANAAKATLTGAAGDRTAPPGEAAGEEDGTVMIATAPNPVATDRHRQLPPNGIDLVSEG